MRITAKTLAMAQERREDKIPVREAWDKVAEDFNAIAPVGLNNSF